MVRSLILPALILISACAFMSALPLWRARARLLARVRADWGREKSRKRDMEAIADFSRSHRPDLSIRDRTWSDLLTDDVFAFLDRTESTIGQQLLSIGFVRLESRIHWRRSKR